MVDTDSVMLTASSPPRVRRVQILAEACTVFALFALRGGPTLLIPVLVKAALLLAPLSDPAVSLLHRWHSPALQPAPLVLPAHDAAEPLLGGRDIRLRFCDSDRVLTTGSRDELALRAV